MLHRGILSTILGHMAMLACLTGGFGGCQKATPPPKLVEPTPLVKVKLAVPERGVAVFGTDKGLFSQKPGKKATLLNNQATKWCAVDNRAQVIWFATGSVLHAFDLVDGVVRDIVAAPDMRIGKVAIVHDEKRRIGAEDMESPTIWLAVYLSKTKPTIAPLLGCEGDASWYCFEMDDVDFKAPMDEWPLQPELAKRKKQLEALAPIDSGYLRKLAARSEGRELYTEPANGPKLEKVQSVAIKECHDDPEGCGEANRISETIWRVVVSNAQGDYFHQDEQFYDSTSKEFIHSDTAARSPLPHQQSSIWGFLVSPTRTHALSYNALISFHGGPAISFEGTACGWVGGGFRIKGPRG
jgi:hypothetical protein